MKKKSFTAEELLFSQGFGTRRECRSASAAGCLAWRGAIVTDPDEPLLPAGELPPEGAVFQYDGKEWPYRRKVLIALNKPAGYECSARPSSHPPVLGLLPPQFRARGVQPVGRLDEDTTGLLVLTDDGPLIHRLTSPRGHVEKVYRAKLRHEAAPGFAATLENGVELRGDGLVRALKCSVTGSCEVEITLTEGRYHQVKRMAAAAGNRVEALKRVRFGALSLPESLPEGDWMWLESPSVIFGE